MYTKEGKKIEFTFTLIQLKNDTYEISLTPTTDDITEDSTFTVDFAENYKETVAISPID